MGFLACLPVSRAPLRVILQTLRSLDNSQFNKLAKLSDIIRIIVIILINWLYTHPLRNSCSSDARLEGGGGNIETWLSFAKNFNKLRADKFRHSLRLQSVVVKDEVRIPPANRLLWKRDPCSYRARFLLQRPTRLPTRTFNSTLFKRNHLKFCLNFVTPDLMQFTVEFFKVPPFLLQFY